ncbi:MAG: hypothetical protein AB7G21_00465 [Dehalococcoidia bacterium]
MTRHPDQQTYGCPQCTKRFDNQEALLQHRRDEHDVRDAEGRATPEPR